MVTPTTGARADANCANVPVIVDEQLHGHDRPDAPGRRLPQRHLLPTASGVPYVTDLQLAHTADGQTIIVYYFTSASTIPKRVIVEEKRSTRPDDRHAAVPEDHLHRCVGPARATGTQWWLDSSSTARNGAIAQQLFPACSPAMPAMANPTVTSSLDYGVVYVYNGDVGQAGTSNGLRRGTFSTTGANCQPRTWVVTPTAGGTKDCHVTGWVDPSYAVYQNRRDDGQQGRRRAPDGGGGWQHLDHGLR